MGRRPKLTCLFLFSITAVVGSVLPSCSDEPITAIQLVLTPDPALGPVHEVLEQIETIQVVVDAPSGLKGVDRSGPLPGGGTAEDWDGDGQLEALFVTAAPAQGDLPVLEIGLTQNAGQELDFFAYGFPPGGDLALDRAAAAGNVVATCPVGQTHQVGVPFNLKASYRPPEVILVLPADGTANVPSSLNSVVVVFSTTIEQESVAQHVHVTSDAGQEIAIDPQLETVIATAGGGVHEERSLLTLYFDENLRRNMQYTVTIGPGIVSQVGRRFDQDPTTSTEEAFTSSFTMPLEGGGTGGTEPCAGCPAGYGCAQGHEGCVPLLGCSKGCQGGFVCDEAQQRCLEDCRVLGLCVDPTATCDQGSGLCQK